MNEIENKINQINQDIKKIRRYNNNDKTKETGTCARSGKAIIGQKMIWKGSFYDKINVLSILIIKLKQNLNNSIFVEPSKDGNTFHIAENDIDKANLLANCIQNHQMKMKDIINMSKIEYVQLCISQKSLNCMNINHNLNIINQKLHKNELWKQSDMYLQCPDNIHNLMLKNVGQSLIDSLMMPFGWSYRISYFSKACKRHILFRFPNHIVTQVFVKITSQYCCFHVLGIDRTHCDNGVNK
ncbi:hypothetical protein RFI_03315, partial [Reticulomyxa filosa]